MFPEIKDLWSLPKPISEMSKKEVAVATLENIIMAPVNILLYTAWIILSVGSSIKDYIEDTKSKEPK